MALTIWVKFMITEKMKCRNCKYEKPLNEFKKSTGYGHRYDRDSICLECHRKNYRQIYSTVSGRVGECWRRMKHILLPSGMDRQTFLDTMIPATEEFRKLYPDASPSIKLFQGKLVVYDTGKGAKLNVSNCSAPVVLPLSAEDRNFIASKIVPKQMEEFDQELDEIRKERDAILATLNNKQCGIKKGYLYLLTNPAWPGYIKIGKALDYKKRVGGYQTGSPFRDYIIHYKSKVFDDRAKAENLLEKILEPAAVFPDEDNEWYKQEVDKGIEIFKWVEGQC